MLRNETGWRMQPDGWEKLEFATGRVEYRRGTWRIYVPHSRPLRLLDGYEGRANSTYPKSLNEAKAVADNTDMKRGIST